MRPIDFLRIDLPLTLLRVLPWRAPTGLVRIGAPGPASPVLLTGNFRLTVERVRRALQGLDVWLLVANSRGVNVWCAATGGLLTDHDVISVLKTSGIETRVNHRRVILPQLAATGIVGPNVRARTGWTVVWGPVDAASIPAYVTGGSEGRDAGRTVSFRWPQRLEMAVAWAFPISLLALLAWPFWPAGVLPLAGLVWGFALALFLAFPLYRPWLRTTRRHRGFVFFDWGERGLPLLLWLLFVAGLSAGAAVTGTFTWTLVLRWGFASIVVLLLLGLDLAGSTPVFKSGLHADRLLRIVLDEQRCKGAGFCEQVCPTGVFTVDHQRHLAMLPHAERCVQCGACIVQCPFDALYFQAPGGDIVAPATVRRFKLNLLGQRVVPRGPDRAAP